jgi:hypothetical protein
MLDMAPLKGLLVSIQSDPINIVRLRCGLFEQSPVESTEAKKLATAFNHRDHLLRNRER